MTCVCVTRDHVKNKQKMQYLKEAMSKATVSKDPILTFRALWTRLSKDREEELRKIRGKWNQTSGDLFLNVTTGKL